MDIAMTGSCIMQNNGKIRSLNSYADLFLMLLVPAPEPIESYMYLYLILDASTWKILMMSNLVTTFGIYVYAKCKIK